MARPLARINKCAVEEEEEEDLGEGLPLTRTHQQLVDLLRRVIPIHSFPLFLFCFFLKVWLFWHSSGLSSLYSFLSFQDYFLWGNPFRPQTVLWTLEHEEGGR